MFHRQKKKQLVNSSLCLTALFLPLQAQAQDDVGTIERIEVTAQKRVQSLQEVPIAINAFDAQFLQTFQLTETDQITQFSANVNATNAAGGMPNYFIRGVGMDDINLSSISAIYKANPFRIFTQIFVKITNHIFHKNWLYLVESFHHYYFSLGLCNKLQ